MVWVALVVVGAGLIAAGAAARGRDLIRPVGQRNRDGAVVVGLVISGLVAGGLLQKTLGYPEALLAVWSAWLVVAVVAIGVHDARDGRGRARG